MRRLDSLYGDEEHGNTILLSDVVFGPKSNRLLWPDSPGSVAFIFSCSRLHREVAVMTSVSMAEYAGNILLRSVELVRWVRLLEGPESPNDKGDVHVLLRTLGRNLQ